MQAQAQEKTQERQFYTLYEVAAILGATWLTVNKMAKRNEFPVIKMGARYFVPKQRFHEWIDKQSDVKEGQACE